MLVDREREVDELNALLKKPPARLVAVSGRHAPENYLRQAMANFYEKAGLVGWEDDQDDQDFYSTPSFFGFNIAH